MGDDGRPPLGERIKELAALHGCARILHDIEQPLPTLLAAVARLLPPAFQYPEHATASVRLGAACAETERHAASAWTLRAVSSAPADVEVVVAYHGDVAWQPVFLDEEQALLDTFAEMLRVELHRRAAWHDLNTERERLALALAVAEMGIWEWDVVGSTVRWSPHLAAFVGHMDGELRGNFLEFERLIHPDDHDGIKATLAAAAVQRGPDRFELGLRLIRPGGGWREVHASAKVIRDDDAHALRVVAVLTDVTHRRVLEAQLRQSQRLEAMGIVAGSVAHDFNNVLSVIVSGGVMLHDRLPRGDDKDLAKDVVDAARRGAGLARQLLTFGRKSEVRRATNDVTTLVKNLDAMLKHLVRPTCSVAIELAPEPFEVWGDAGQLEQLVINLVLNARDAMAERDGGVVEIATCPTDLALDPAWPDAQIGRGVELSVRDVGTGIAPEVVARIFEPFFTTKPPGEGTGLGLAVVFGVVKELRGQIAIDTAVGVGTTMRVKLPLQAR